jgi:hypothetical protein
VTVKEKLSALDVFMKQVSTGLDVDVQPDTEDGKKNLMAVRDPPYTCVYMYAFYICIYTKLICVFNPLRYCIKPIFLY